MQNQNAESWLREEHRIVTDLTDKLKMAVAVIPAVHRDEWLDNVRRDFSRLRVHLKKHMREEENGGFMAPVLERRPTLAPEVDHLKHEHAELTHWLDNIWEELESIRPDEKLMLEDTCHRIQHVVSAIHHHEEHEEMLVTFVFSQDIGGHN